MSKKNYDVGYKKPPVNGRFRKGQSGNPNGRPKGRVTTVDADAALDRALSAIIPVNEGGRPRKLRKLDVMYTQTVNRGLKGHHPSISLVVTQLARRAASEAMSEAEPAGKTDEEAKNELLAYFREMRANLSADKGPPSTSNKDDSADTPKADR